MWERSDNNSNKQLEPGKKRIYFFNQKNQNIYQIQKLKIRTYYFQIHKIESNENIFLIIRNISIWAAHTCQFD